MKGINYPMAQKLKQNKDISIGENLSALRIESNMTQEQVAAQLQLRNFSTPGSPTLKWNPVNTISGSVN